MVGFGPRSTLRASNEVRSTKPMVVDMSLPMEVRPCSCCSEQRLLTRRVVSTWGVVVLRHLFAFAKRGFNSHLSVLRQCGLGYRGDLVPGSIEQSLTQTAQPVSFGMSLHQLRILWSDHEMRFHGLRKKGILDVQRKSKRWTGRFPPHREKERHRWMLPLFGHVLALRA